jgi:hypothetical protein
MKQPSVYLKMRVLGAVDTVAGRTRHERVHAVAAMTFTDEDGHARQFTWRTIQTWFYRYKNRGITGMTPQPRRDKGHARKATPEELLEAIHAAKPPQAAAVAVKQLTRGGRVPAPGPLDQPKVVVRRAHRPGLGGHEVLPPGRAAR